MSKIQVCSGGGGGGGGDKNDCTLYKRDQSSVHWVDHDLCGGISWVHCNLGISWVHWGMFSALRGYHECIGENIMSTLEVFYNNNSILPMHWWYPPMHWTAPNALRYLPDALNNPQWTDDIPQCTEYPQCTAQPPMHYTHVTQSDERYFVHLALYIIFLENCSE